MSSSNDHLPPAEGLSDVVARMEKARAAAIEPAPFTTLVAVTKTHGEDRIRPVLDVGHRVFGENRVQEAKEKWPALKRDYPYIALHLIGPLQTNKIRDAVSLFDTIQTLDRPKLARALQAERARCEKFPALFIQVNTGEEPQKAGVLPSDAPQFIAFCRDEMMLPVQGLMCIPPLGEPAAPHFALLRKIARNHDLPYLSMGMSGDFETAIKFGATHVRVGTAIFGERQT